MPSIECEKKKNSKVKMGTKVHIVDCTIRDGGYLFDKNSDPEFVKGILQGLVDAGIDYMETGFLQSKVNGETIVYRNSKDVVKYLPRDPKQSTYLGFCDNSRYTAEELDACDGKSFKWLRISFAKHEIEDSLEFCKAAQAKGYRVQFNPMDSISYTAEERVALVAKVNRVKPAVFSIVDTFGAMYMTDLEDIFRQFDSRLDKDIMIGLHSHDNLGLSCALAERMVQLAEETGREVCVDGSLYGMGRGAGNAKTELLADYLNKHCGTQYNVQVLLETIDKYIMPVLSYVHWGYDLPMFICGTKHSHVDNVNHLNRTTDCSITDMFNIIDTLTPQQRTRYGAGYSKTDFSQLDQQYQTYKNNQK
jgi:4-hydroxy 2-oxovalerate aldolase